MALGRVLDLVRNNIGSLVKPEMLLRYLGTIDVDAVRLLHFSQDAGFSGVPGYAITDG